MASMGEEVNCKHKFNGELYNALTREDNSKVIELCQKASENALHILTIHNDTVLHMATCSEQGYLLCELLDKLPERHLDKMTHQNHLGNTILHEAATLTDAHTVAGRVLQKVPGLLGMRNHCGETVLFQAARFGQIEMFDFLADRISGYNQAAQQTFLQRSDKTTALHISILYHHFELAVKIANSYIHLINEKDIDGMTGLQLLSCNPSAFNSGREDALLKRLIKSIKLCCSSAKREEMKKEKQRYKSALELAEFLIKRDTSWEATYLGVDMGKPKLHRYGVNSNIASSNDQKGGGEGTSTSSLGRGERGGETPLCIATKSGSVEIVKKILKLFPQAVEHIDDDGRNILHVAIKYRQLKIFELVKKMEVPMKRLVRKVDNKGNSILHMVGIKRKDYMPEKLQGPALELQEELLWFESVKEVTPIHLINHQNHMKQTAGGLFDSNNSQLRNLATEWLKRTSEGCSIVAVLIATVAFAAAYTIPGGPNENTGLPVLLDQPFFVVFTVTDVLSLTFALTAVVTFLSILTAPFRMQDFKRSLPNKLVLGFTFLFLSVSMMMIAFAATIVLMIHNNERWLKIALYATSFLPVCIFAVSNLPLYLSLSRTYKYLFKKAGQAFLWRNRVPVLCMITKFFINLTTQTHPTRSESTRSTRPATPRTARFPI